MKWLPSPVVVSIAALLLLCAAAIPPGAARDADNVPVPQASATSSNLLDGKTFVTQSGEKGKQASNKDTVVFRNGRFLSEGCTQWGFGDGPYRATDDGAAIRFHAETHSATHGTMVWDGIVRGDAIEATNHWTRKRWYWNIEKDYWYRGQLKK